MSFFEAIFLGLVQGVTEFLPISSSGHLTILSGLLHINTDTGVLFEVLVHLGTLFAIIAVFRQDLLRMTGELIHMCGDLKFNLQTWFYNKLHEHDEKRYKKILHNNYRKLTAMLFLSTIPTAIIGYLMQGIVEKVTGSLLAAGLGFLVTAVLLLVVDNWNYGQKIPKDMTSGQAIMIGICQGIGIFPGISRSGITITAGLLCGLKKGFAVRYSFLLAVPAILGATILELKEFAAPVMTVSLGFSYLCGMITAAISGYFCIKIMLGLIQKKKFRFFAVYCFVIGVAALICNFTLV